MFLRDATRRGRRRFGGEIRAGTGITGIAGIAGIAGITGIAVLAAVVTATALCVTACGGTSTPKTGGVRVVTTTTILRDVVSGIVTCAGGGSVTALMPVGADPHDFAPSSADITKMVRADLVVANGLGLEEGLKDAITNASRDGAKVFEVAPKLDPIPFAAEIRDHRGEPSAAGSVDTHAAGAADPHVWQDVARMARAALLVSAQLGRTTHDTVTFDRCGAKVSDELTAVDAEVRSTLAAIPTERRVLITDHNAFGYFATAYGFDLAGVVVPGGSTLAAPSSAEMARLVEVIKQKKVQTVFSNTALPADLISTIAREAGTRVSVVALFVDSLGKPGSGAETYPAMMRTNARRIAAALAA